MARKKEYTERRKRIHKKGLFAGSTSIYNDVVDKYDNIQSFHEPEKIYNTVGDEYMISLLGKPVRMTKKQFFRHNLSVSILDNLQVHLPKETSISKRAKLYKSIRDYLHQLIEKKERAQYDLDSSLHIA